MNANQIKARKTEVHAKMVAAIESGKVNSKQMSRWAAELDALNAEHAITPEIEPGFFASPLGQLQAQLIAGTWAGF